MIDPLVQEGLAIRGGANEVSGTVRCDPWGHARVRPRMVPMVLLIGLLAIFLAYPWNFLAVLAAVLLIGTFVLPYALSPNTEVVPWQLRGARLTLAGRAISLAGIDGYDLWMDPTGNTWHLDLTDEGAPREQLRIDSEHGRAEVEWLAAQILLFGHSKAAAPENLMQLRSARREGQD